MADLQYPSHLSLPLSPLYKHIETKTKQPPPQNKTLKPANQPKQTNKQTNKAILNSRTPLTIYRNCTFKKAT